MANWLKPELSLSAQLELESSRRQVPRLSRQDLEAVADSALCHAYQMDAVARQALARVIELECREAAGEAARPRHRHWAAELMAQLRGTGPAAAS